MKKVVLFITALSISFAAQAQGALDALRYSLNYYEGSARSVAMGNAFTSLGGDLGAITLNPAASGVFKYSEFTITPSLNFNNSTSKYLGNDPKENYTKIALSNVGFTTHIKPRFRTNGLVSSNFSFVVNRTNNYNMRQSAFGTESTSSWLSSLAHNTSGIHATNLDIRENSNYNPFYDFPAASWRSILAWNSNLMDTLPDSGSDYISATENISGLSIIPAGALNQNFFRETKGGKSEFILNWGGNIANRLFVGANIGVESLNYSDYQEYSEEAVNPSQFNSKFSKFTHAYRLNTSGVGVNLKFGFIYLPVKGLRIGASIATPTWYSLHDEYEESIDALFSDGYRRKLITPLGEYDYNLNTPLRLNAGVSYVFGKYAILSFDYESVDYSTMKLKNDSYMNAFTAENQEIKQHFTAVNNFRAGVEIRPVKNFALRGGYSFYENPEKNIGNDSHVISGGLGFTGAKGSFLDIAYQQRLDESENFSLYGDVPNHSAPIGQITKSAWRLLVTLGIRF